MENHQKCNACPECKKAVRWKVLGTLTSATALLYKVFKDALEIWTSWR